MIINVGGQPERVRESSDGQLSGFGVAQSAEGVEAAEDVGVGLLLVPSTLVRSQPTLATLGQSRCHFPASTVLNRRKNNTQLAN